MSRKSVIRSRFRVLFPQPPVYAQFRVMSFLIPPRPRLPLLTSNVMMVEAENGGSDSIVLSFHSFRFCCSTFGSLGGYGFLFLYLSKIGVKIETYEKRPAEGWEKVPFFSFQGERAYEIGFLGAKHELLGIVGSLAFLLYPLPSGLNVHGNEKRRWQR